MIARLKNQLNFGGEPEIGTLHKSSVHHATRVLRRWSARTTESLEGKFQRTTDSLTDGATIMLTFPIPFLPSPFPFPEYRESRAMVFFVCERVTKISLSKKFAQKWLETERTEIPKSLLMSVCDCELELVSTTTFLELTLLRPLYNTMCLE